MKVDENLCRCMPADFLFNEEEITSLVKII